VTKRFFDIIVSLSGIVVAMPIMVVVALLIKLETRGAVIFTQVRVGRYGYEFNIYKFRSMVVDAETQGPYFTQEGDTRVTRVGRIIRKTSLDELPQLYNVLIGDMSFVGPRPNVPAQKNGYEKTEWDKRNSIRPGITGLAQALMRSSATPEQRTRLDLEYIDKVSLLFDIKIIIKTFLQIVTKGGN
jgi:lipopolysaccharide/colanic/teichoic acid biosynthesis glycosyltransferase